MQDFFVSPKVLNYKKVHIFFCLISLLIYGRYKFTDFFARVVHVSFSNLSCILMYS